MLGPMVSGVVHVRSDGIWSGPTTRSRYCGADPGRWRPCCNRSRPALRRPPPCWGGLLSYVNFLQVFSLSSIVLVPLSPHTFF